MGEDKKNVARLLFNQVEEELRKGSLSRTSVAMMFETQMNVQAMVKGPGAATLGTKMRGGDRIEITKTEEWKEAIRINILAMISESTELLEWTPWKPWSQKHIDGFMEFEDLYNAKFEIVDVLCFMLNLWALMGGTGEELAVMHRVKCDENIQRQKENY